MAESRPSDGPKKAIKLKADVRPRELLELIDESGSDQRKDSLAALQLYKRAGFPQMKTMRILILLAAVVLYGAAASAQPNGEECRSDSDCQSGSCYPGPSATAGAGTRHYCLRNDLNCAWPRSEGGRYDEVRSSGQREFVCVNPGNGQRAQFVARVRQAQPVANGLPCQVGDDCKSGYCSSSTGSRFEIKGLNLCMGPEKNCPMPGSDGIMYHGEYSFGDSQYMCEAGYGLRRVGPANPETPFYDGGRCKGIRKIDCRAKWLPLVEALARAYCATHPSAKTNHYGAAFCAVALPLIDRYWAEF